MAVFAFPYNWQEIHEVWGEKYHAETKHFPCLGLKLKTKWSKKEDRATYLAPHKYE